jgi:hypothetical protein
MRLMDRISEGCPATLRDTERGTMQISPDRPTLKQHAARVKKEARIDAKAQAALSRPKTRPPGVSQLALQAA